MSKQQAAPKGSVGNFFEDFRLGQTLVHATPRTVTDGDVALYTALYGSRFAVQSSSEFARALGYEQAPVDDMLLFHIVFGKTVPDLSLNAVANLGYADGRFTGRVYPGDTLRTVSRVIGLKPTSNGKAGVVWVESTGLNQKDEPVLRYIRWVMVRRKSPGEDLPTDMEIKVPELPASVPASDIPVPKGLDLSSYDTALSGEPHMWDDYEVGERINHRDGTTIEEAEHMMATRLYQNTAKVHFDQYQADQGRFKRRLIYGGHIISIARALSFNGLANAFHIAAINAGSHANPTFAGDTIYAWSEVLDRQELPGRRDIGALRLRTVAVKNTDPGAFAFKGEDGKYLPEVVLDLDYTALVPRRA